MIKRVYQQHDQRGRQRKAHCFIFTAEENKMIQRAVKICIIEVQTKANQVNSHSRRYKEDVPLRNLDHDLRKRAIFIDHFLFELLKNKPLTAYVHLFK